MRSWNQLAFITGALVGAVTVSAEVYPPAAAIPPLAAAPQFTPQVAMLPQPPRMATTPISAAVEAPGPFTEAEEAAAIDREIASDAAKGETARLSHAKELLGKYYSTSVVKSGEKIGEIGKFVTQTVQASLAPKFRAQARKIAATLLSEAKKHEFDPVFLMAVIRSESSFNPNARGSAGEIGLMQLMPKTGRWMSKRAHVAWKGKKTLQDPVSNIKLGAAYLAFLRERFDSHGRLYLAAYNMGSTNVHRALGKKIWPKTYPARVMQRYVALYTELKEGFLKKARTPALTDTPDLASIAGGGPGTGTAAAPASGG